jgi:hypothetical protein
VKVAEDKMKQVVEEKQVILASKAKTEQALIEARAELARLKQAEGARTKLRKIRDICDE